jgi:uncharacterized protein (DUF1015 family)
MRIFPFVGTRYTAAAGDPGSLAAPPYDQIDNQTRARLHTEELQFSQLTVPDPTSRPDPAGHSAALHQSWLERGVIARDAAAGVYPYEIVTPQGARRLGLCALVGLQMLRTSGCDLEPILILADDHGALDEALSAATQNAPPLIEHQDPHGSRHRLYPAMGATGYAAILGTAQGVIADGNTRWQTARSRAAELGLALGEAGGDLPQATKLAVITSLESPGVVIDPIHRGVATRLDMELAAELAAERRPWQGESGNAFAAAVAAAPQPALGVAVTGRPSEIWRLSERTTLAPPRARLVACRLHDEVLRRLGLAPETATDGTVTYRSDPDQLWHEQASGGLESTFYLPPMSPRVFGDAIAAGELMPPKSTRFLPKLVSGLVWHEQLR